MKDVKSIIPDSSINATATIGLENKYVNAETGKTVSNQLIDSALQLGLSIEPKYKTTVSSKIKIKVGNNNSTVEFTKESFDVFVLLFHMLTKKEVKLTPNQFKLTETWSKQLYIVRTKNFTKKEVILTFPGGETFALTPKIAKFQTIAPLIPDHYFDNTICLAGIGSYSITYYDKNKSFKVGCNTIKAERLFDWFEQIKLAWEEIDLDLSLLNEGKK